MWTTPRQLFPVLPPTEEFCSLAEFTPPTGYEPKLLDNFHYSETTEMISSRRNPATKKRSSRTCVMRNSTMRSSGKRYLHHCSFRREENQRIEDKLITLMKKVYFQLSPFSHVQVRRDPYTNRVRLQNGNQVATWKTKESGFSLKDKEQILAEIRSEIQKH